MSTNANLPIDASSRVGLAYKSAYITSQTTTLVKTGAGFIHSVTFNKPTATGTCELDNAITNTNPFAIITTPASPMPVTLIYDVYFDTGLSVTTATADQNITISYI